MNDNQDDIEYTEVHKATDLKKKLQETMTSIIARVKVLQPDESVDFTVDEMEQLIQFYGIRKGYAIKDPESEVYFLDMTNELRYRAFTTFATAWQVAIIPQFHSKEDEMPYAVKFTKVGPLTIEWMEAIKNSENGNSHLH